MSFFRLLILSTLAAIPSAASAAPRTSDLLVHGSDERFWIAQYEAKSASHPDEPHTVLYFRGPGDAGFTRFGTGGGHILALANRGTQLAALMEGGEWLMASEVGNSSEGPPLPGGARVVDLAGGDDTFWAISGAGVLPPPASTNSSLEQTTGEPTTGPTTSQSPPTTQAVAFPPSLFRLDNGVWTSLGPIPRDATRGVERPSLAIVNHNPYLAITSGVHVVRVMRFDGSAWKSVAMFSDDASVTTVRLLRGAAMPVIWIAREKTADTLDFLNDSGTARRVVLSFVPSSAPNVGVGYALGRIRVLFGAGADISEQDLDATDGSLVGPVAKVLFPTDVPIFGIVHVMQYVIWTALFLAILGAMRWRRRMQGMVFDLEKIHLAPLGRRASAGLIDLFPIIIGIAIFEQPISAHAREIVIGVSMGGYLLHTALAEMFTGRSLGKWLLGMRVVSLTGERPQILSLLLRNVLRVIDVGLLFVPLVVVIVSPLRQRTGDVAAGTLVVRSE